MIQKHHATHLHYDFRLELNGVLKSWAVPKGPSLDPAVKRLAMHVEDHPVEYGRFEGTIPKGEYGGGTVMLWDRGYWEPIGDPEEGYRKGRWKFRLEGEKLHGGWVLVRTGHTDDDSRRWLLIKERDEESRPADELDVLEHLPMSVKTGRSLDEIAAGAASRKPASKRKIDDPSGRNGRAASRRRGPSAGDELPHRFEVQLAQLAAEAPDGADWQHEIKFDGYRMICRIDSGRATFISRNHLDWTGRLKALAVEAEKLPVRQAVLDGEVVALRPDGTTHFQDLQNAFASGKTDVLRYFAFDLLHLDGKDLAGLPLQERRAALAKMLSRRGVPPAIKLSEQIDGHGPAFFREACRKGLEGIICKRKDQPYKPGRGADWLKVKCKKHDEFVIGGFTEPKRSRAGIGAILVGYYNPKRELVYSGKVGTGFDGRALPEIRRSLSALRSAHSPFRNLPRAPATTHWVEPRLVAQVEFGSVTGDGILRHAAFQGLREDKAATDVQRRSAAERASKGDGRRTMPAKKANVEPRGRVRAEGYDESTQQFDGVRMTSPDKVLYPEAGITKLELAQYYRSMAKAILPHIIDRPLSLVRCPDGLAGGCFFQKHPGPGTPDTLRRFPVREKNETGDYAVVDDVAGLISLAQIGVLEIHAWGSRTDRLEFPDRMTFDLDPDPAVPWKGVVNAARQVREFLADLGLESFLKSTGGKGLHLVVPINRRHEWPEVKSFCRAVAEAVVRADPARFTATISKAARTGKIFVDYLRNDRGATAIVPFSPRAKPTAPVAVPLAWSELSSRRPSGYFTIRTVAKRLKAIGHDPWKELAEVRQGLTEPLKRLTQVSSPPTNRRRAAKSRS